MGNEIQGMERREQAIRLRTQPTKGASRVDREQRVIYGVSVAQAVEAIGHDLILDDISLAQIAEQGNSKRVGVKSRFTHPGLSEDGLGKLVGRVKNMSVEGDKVLGDLYIAESASRAPSGDLAGYVMDLAEQDPEAFGMSVVISVLRVWVLGDGREVEAKGEKPPEGATNKKPMARVTALHACDVVDEPAANRDGLFSAQMWGSNQLSEEVYGELDYYLGYMGVTPRKAYQFVLKYFGSRGVNVMENVMETGTQAASESVDIMPEVDVWGKAQARAAVRSMVLASGLPAVARDRLIGQEWSSPDLLEAGIDAERKYIASLGNGVTGMRPVTERDMVTPLEAAQNAMEWLFGAPGAQTPDPQLRSLRDLYVALTGDIDFYGVFNRDYVKFAAATTATMPGMATNALNKVVMMHYDNMATFRWFEEIVNVTPHDGSTHPVQLILMDGLAALPTIAEGQSYGEATVGDSKASIAFRKKGRYVGITLEMIRRSDIQRIRAIPRELVKAAVRTRSAAIAAIFTTASGVGPTLADDSTVLFHSNHGNLGTAAFSAAEWAVARRRLWEQVIPGTSNGVLGLWPTFALIPIELYDTALELFGYGAGAGSVGKPSTAGTAQTVNPYGETRPGDPRPTPIAVPEWTNVANWAYIVDPRLHPVIHMAYANAPEGGLHPAPEVFQVTSETVGLMFTNDTLPIKVRDWWAYGVATYVGIGKNNV